MMELLQELFHVKEKGSSLRTELLASATSFFSIVYIVAVNALILSQAGMDYNSVVIATILTTAVSNILMGLYANSPLILAPGMSDNAISWSMPLLLLGNKVYRLSLSSGYSSFC